MRAVARAVAVVVVGWSVVGCGEVPAVPKDSSTGNGSDDAPSGGPCVTDDQCSEPTPHCSPDNGCVGCVQSAQCPATAPTCDVTTHACRACTTDADCASAVCDATNGQCTPEAQVLYASPTGPDAGTCTPTAPCSIAHATAIADATRRTIKLATGAYTAALTFTGSKNIVIHGYGATISGGTSPVFEVNEGARLRVVGAALSSATSNSTIRCESASTATPVLELYRATLDNNSTVLLGNPCTLSAEESVIRTTSTTSYLVVLVAPGVSTFNRTRFFGGGGLAGLSTANIQIANSVFKGVGTPASHGTFVGGTYNVTFSTIVDSIVECGASGATGLTLNSSILTNTSAGAPADTLVGVNSCTSVKYTVVSPPQSAPIGATNVIGAAQLKNVAGGDYHLLSSSPAIDRGDPASTNAIDFDGVMRPTGSGRDSGAFEYKP